MRQPTSVLIYPVKQVNEEWKYLLLHRVPRPDLGLPSFWQGITGGLEDYESIESAAKRELCEETGIVFSCIEAIGYSYSIPIQDEWRKKYVSGVQEIVEHVYIAFLEIDQEPVLSIEHNRLKWCREDEALKLLTYPGNIEGLKRCSLYLKSHSKSLKPTSFLGG
jgi:dATP pyrophosphohydrolase